MSKPDLIKVIALDIYGTVLATKDPENALPSRKGLNEFFYKCDECDIKIVTASDNSLFWTKEDLKATGINLDRFDGFYELTEDPKEFFKIRKAYELDVNELLVIGDGQKDRDGALKYHSCFIRVPEYVGWGDKFDLRSLEF